VPPSAGRTGKTAGALTKRRLERASVPRSAGRTGKTASLLTKRLVERASVPRSADRTGKTAGALTKTSLPGRVKARRAGSRRPSSPASGCETNVAAEMAPTFPLRSGRETRNQVAWRPHFPSDGDAKHDNAPPGAHFSPPTGTQNAKTRRLAPTHDTVRGSWVGRGPGGTWRQAWHVQPGVARPSSGASGVVSGACRATDGYRDICARAAQALGCGSAALSASGRATRRAGTVLAVAASWSNFPFRQRAGGALPEAIGSVLMWEGERSKRYGNKPKPGRLGRLGEVGSSRTKNTA